MNRSHHDSDEVTRNEKRDVAAFEPLELDDEAIRSLVSLAEEFRRMLRQMLAEGYRIECGRILPPDQSV